VAVNKKRYPLVSVTWRDSHGGDPGWVPAELLPNEPIMIRSVGHFLAETEETIMLGLSCDEIGQVSGFIVIPKVNVTRIVELVPRKRS
jgi:hypothetical protein